MRWRASADSEMLNVNLQVNQVTFYHLPEQQQPCDPPLIVRQRPLRQIAAQRHLISGHTLTGGGIRFL